MFLWCLGYSVGTSRLHPQWLNSSANLTTFIWFWAQRCAFPFIFLQKGFSPAVPFSHAIDQPQNVPSTSHLHPFHFNLPSYLPHSKSSIFPSHILPIHGSNLQKFLELYLIFVRQYHQPPHFKVYSDQPLQLRNELHFGWTDLLYALVKVTHPSKACTSQINQKIWLCSTLANFTPSKIHK